MPESNTKKSNVEKSTPPPTNTQNNAIDIKSQIPSPPSKDSTQEKLLAYAQTRITAAESHTTKSKSLKEAASSLSISEEEKASLLSEAEQHEKKTKAEMKAVSRIESGVWQGAGMGGGMGAGVGMGLGTVVGTVVGGVVSVPTTGLGVLAGAGTGAVHGPWFTIPGAEGMRENREGEGDGEGKVEGDNEKGGDEKEGE